MMNYIKTMLLVAASGILLSCERQDEIVAWSEGESTIAIPQVNGVSQGFFNLLDVQNAFVEFDLDVVGNASEVELLMNIDGGDFLPVQTVSTFPSTVSVRLSEVSDVLGINPADLEPGDTFGMIFLTSVGASVYNSGTTLTFNSACPSDLVSGTYSLSVNMTSTCCGLTLGNQPGGSLGLTGIEIVNEGAGVYTVPDILGGHIVPFNIDPEPIQVIDVCGIYSLRSGASALDYTGAGSGVTIDAATGIWTITFNNEGNGIAGVATLSPE